MAVDIGGTFTDLVATDEEGNVYVSKSLTTPADLTDGLFDALKFASEQVGMPLNKFLEETVSFVHGTTVATNAIIGGTTSKIGLICNDGFRDILCVREAGKKDMFNLREPRFPPFVPRYLTLPVRGRINSEGSIEVPLNEDDVRKSAKQLKEYNVEAIAICLLWSHINGTHEQRVREIVNEEWSGVPTVLSHELNPTIREYRRTISTCINASLLPVLQKYLSNLKGRLENSGYRGELYVVTSGGGVVPAAEIYDKPVLCIHSGPAMIPPIGIFLGQLERNTTSVVTIDMGGTSFDVSASKEGQIEASKESLVRGDTIGIRSLEILSIGAGGGSIAGIDPAGLLYVGPRSAGAVPGPACYMQGGEEPTVTDADLVLGYINPDCFAGGRVKIDPRLAWRVIERKIAKPLGLSVEQAAFSIYSVVNQNMVTGISDVTLRQGVDPSESLLVIGGGATPIHCVAIARDLGIKEIIIPKHAGVLSALGGVGADMLCEFVGSFYTTSREFDCEGVNTVIEGLEEAAHEFFLRAGIPTKDRRIEYATEARYGFQAWEIEMPLRFNRISPALVGQMIENFHLTHKRKFAVSDPTGYVEFLLWIVRAVGVRPNPPFRAEPDHGEDASEAFICKQRAYSAEVKAMVDMPVYAGLKLRSGNKIRGMALIEEPTTSIFISYGSVVTITKYGNYFIETMV